MFNINNLLGLLQDLSLKADDIEIVKNICDKAKYSQDDLVKIVASSILKITYEIDNYLSYYEEEIEKCFAGASSKVERQRIFDAVFAKLIKENSLLTQGLDNKEIKLFEVVSLFASIIDGWNIFEKESIAKV